MGGRYASMARPPKNWLELPRTGEVASQVTPPRPLPPLPVTDITPIEKKTLSPERAREGGREGGREREREIQRGEERERERETDRERERERKQIQRNQI